MKAALFEKPHSLTVVDRPVRKLGAGDVLVRVESCGICGTDVHIIEGSSRSSPPVVLGHEYTGTVADIGAEVSTVSAGMRVAVDPNISCGVCAYCRRGLVHLCSALRALGVDIDGGMAQYCVVPERQLYVLPEDFPAEAGPFVEPVSCAIHGIDRAGISTGDTVVILGGGTIGLLMMQLARHAGAAKVIVVEPLERKRRIAQQLGASVILDPAAGDPLIAIKDLTSEGADVVIECVGHPGTAEQALAMARRGGTVEFFGVCPIGATIPLEPNGVYFRELTITGSYINPHTISRSIAALQGGLVLLDAFTIDRFPLDGVHEALAFQREGKTIKSIVEPWR